MILETLLLNWHIILLFLMVAILYSSVGFGGGSSYIAILALTSIAFVELRAIALLCNILVVSVNVYQFQKEKVFNWKKIIPLVVFSVPFAFFGGYLKISQLFFFILLGITLFFAAITMWFSKKPTTFTPTKNTFNILKNASYGSFIGFLSGMVGIGGGIFLAPLLHLSNWDTPKKIAATASIFILVNSISGLIGQSANPEFTLNWSFALILMITVFIGGKIGNIFRNKLLSPIQLKKATALLIAFVGFRILYQYLFS